MERDPFGGEHVLVERFEKFTATILKDEILDQAVAIVLTARESDPSGWIVGGEPILRRDDEGWLYCGLQIEYAWLVPGIAHNPGAKQATYGTRSTSIEVDLFQWSPHSKRGMPSDHVFDAVYHLDPPNGEELVKESWEVWLSAMKAVAGKVYQTDGADGYSLMLNRDTGHVAYARDIEAGHAIEIKLPES